MFARAKTYSVIIYQQLKSMSKTWVSGLFGGRGWKGKKLCMSVPLVKLNWNSRVFDGSLETGTGLFGIFVYNQHLNRFGGRWPFGTKLSGCCLLVVWWSSSRAVLFLVYFIIHIQRGPTGSASKRETGTQSRAWEPISNGWTLLMPMG